MPKVVINACFGGFSLSRAALDWLRERGHAGAIDEIAAGEEYPDTGKICEHDYGFCRDIDRADPLLVEVVSLLGRAAAGDLASLRIVDVPDNAEWEISEYDGSEHVAEKHRTWS